jgi:hypothetical protein
VVGCASGYDPPELRLEPKGELADRSAV